MALRLNLSSPFEELLKKIRLIIKDLPQAFRPRLATGLAFLLGFQDKRLLSQVSTIIY